MKEITTGSPPWDNDPVWDTTSTACLPQDRVTKNPSGEVKWVKVTQLCPTLCDPMDYTVHGILQARTLEWVAIPSPGDPPNPGMESRSPTLRADYLPAEPQGKLRFRNHQVGSCKGKTLSTWTKLFKKKKNSPGNKRLLKSVREIAPGKEEFHSPYTIMML